MKHSATPLHCGSPTYDNEIMQPRHFTLVIQASAQGPSVSSDRRRCAEVWHQRAREGPANGGNQNGVRDQAEPLRLLGETE
jgi:hypothetical protein